ncbi:hypothetical protein [Formosa sp. A9]|uniref:hypothetical protein n=1 Tax=Formosa sp. A9 TaxID=3442641 RepID=UPI003EBEC436
MKKFFLLCSLFVGTSTLILSCSSSDDGSTEEPIIEEPVATSITLSADVTTIDMGDSITLTVMNDLDENVTATSTYYVNESEISQVFTPNQAGSYTIHATNDGLTSNTVTVEVNAVQEDNAIFFEAVNYEVKNSILAYFGPVDALDDGAEANTHGLWAVVAGNGDFQNTESTNYIQLVLLTDLDEEGVPVAPSMAETTHYYALAFLGLDGEEIVDEFGHETEAMFSLNSDFSETVDFSYTALIDGVPVALDYNTTFLGAVDQTEGDRTIGVTPISEVSTKMNPSVLNALLSK